MAAGGEDIVTQFSEESFAWTRMRGCHGCHVVTSHSASELKSRDFAAVKPVDAADKLFNLGFAWQSLVFAGNCSSSGGLPGRRNRVAFAFSVAPVWSSDLKGWWFVLAGNFSYIL